MMKTLLGRGWEAAALRLNVAFKPLNIASIPCKVPKTLRGIEAIFNKLD